MIQSQIRRDVEVVSLITVLQIGTKLSKDWCARIFDWLGRHQELNCSFQVQAGADLQGMSVGPHHTLQIRPAQAAHAHSLLISHCIRQFHFVVLLTHLRNNTVMDLSFIVEGEFFIKFHLRNKSDDFKWILMAIYGLAQDEFKTAFLSEMVRTCQQNPLPTLIGGDFNIMRHSREKIKITSTTDGLSYSMMSLIVSIFGKLI